MKVRIEELSFSYSPLAEPVIHGLTHSFAEGSITAVTGPSGRGKSTLLYLIGLMLTPTKGLVEIEGLDMGGVGDTRRSAIRGEHISMVFQDALLDPARTTLGNVLEGAVYTTEQRNLKEGAQTLLDSMGVGHRASHRPGEVACDGVRRRGDCNRGEPRPRPRCGVRRSSGSLTLCL